MVRDKQAVDKIVETVRATLYACPEQRLAQVISNALGGDPFYMEDAEAIVKLRQYGEYVADGKTY